jgi:hypothetical protein
MRCSQTGLFTPAYTPHAHVNVARSARWSDGQSTSSVSLNVIPHNTDVYASNEAINWAGAWVNHRDQVRVMISATGYAFAATLRNAEPVEHE